MASTPLSVTRFRLIFSFCWMILLCDHAVVLNKFGLQWADAIIDSAISNGLLLLACLLIMNTIRYYMPQRDRYFNIFACCVVLSLITVGSSKFLLILAIET